MRKINTLAELKAEQKALRIRKADLESDIRKDIDEIKTDLEPLMMVSKGIKNMLSSKDNSIMGASAGTAANFIAKNTIFRNSGFITRLIMPFFVKNITSNVVENNKSQIVDWVENLISKFTKKDKVEESA
jgi:hypothetical protein